MDFAEWTAWQPFPARNGDRLRFPTAPLGPGVYELRHQSSQQKILFGIGEIVGERMQSLAPEPWGQGTRNNSDKREYVLHNHADIEFRTLSCKTRTEAAGIEATLNRADYIFSERRGVRSPIRRDFTTHGPLGVAAPIWYSLASDPPTGPTRHIILTGELMLLGSDLFLANGQGAAIRQLQDNKRGEIIAYWLKAGVTDWMPMLPAPPPRFSAI